MEDEPIRKYSKACEELDKAVEEVESLQSLIGEVFKALDNPYKLMVSNVSNVDVNFPPEVAMVGGIPTLNADNWPTAKKIAQVLSNLHRKRRNAKELWFALSNADKKIVTRHRAIE